MIISAKDKIRRAVDGIFDTNPLFASLVARWKFQPCSQIPTFATDGQRLLWNPQFAEKLNIAEITWVLLHEAGHVFLGHHVRAIGKKHKLFNQSADISLNQLIKTQVPSEAFRKQFLFAGEGQYADLPEGESAEWYYSKLDQQQKDQQQKDQQQKDQQQKDHDGKGDEQSSGQSGEDQQKGQNDPQKGNNGQHSQDEGTQDETLENGSQSEKDSQSGESGQDGQSEAQKGQSGPEQPGKNEDVKNGKPSQTGGENEDWTLDKLDDPDSALNQAYPIKFDENASPGEVFAAPAETEAAAEIEWKEMVAQAVNAAKQCGNLPGWLLEKSEELLGKSETNWKAILRQFVTNYARSGHSYSRPNRRSAHRADIILPARRSRSASKGCVLVDTSGSMSQAECNKALEEIESVLGAFPGSEVTLVQCDTREIKDGERKFSRWDFPLRVPTEWLGRGGTDLNPALQSIGKRSAEFKWLIVVTDFAWSAAQAVNPGLPTLWISTTGRKGYSQPTFGTFANLK